MIFKIVDDWCRKWLGDHYKTTLAGVCAGLIPILQGGHPTLRDILFGVGIALLGVLAKG